MSSPLHEKCCAVAWIEGCLLWALCYVCTLNRIFSALKAALALWHNKGRFLNLQPLRDSTRGHKPMTSLITFLILSGSLLNAFRCSSGPWSYWDDMSPKPAWLESMGLGTLVGTYWLSDLCGLLWLHWLLSTVWKTACLFEQKEITSWLSGSMETRSPVKHRFSFHSFLLLSISNISPKTGSYPLLWNPVC